MINPRIISENLKYHIERGISVAESIFRPGSAAHIQLLVEARSQFDAGEMNFTGVDTILFIETDLGKTDIFNGKIVALDFPIEEFELYEAQYH
jgi:hypothetical protein